MKHYTTTHKDVCPITGKCSAGGAVHIAGHVGTSEDEGGCGLGNCQCSNGHWIAISQPINQDNEVICNTWKFDSHKEMIEFVLSKLTSVT